MPLQVFPSSGPVPLTVEIRWWVYPIENPVRVEFDADGNGVPEWSQPGFESGPGQRGYTYRQEGQYQLTVRVHDRGGRVTVYTAPVTVSAPAAFEAELQGRWTSMKTALRRGDIPVALECIHSESRPRYRDVFMALANRLAQDVDQIFTNIQLAKQGPGGATYEMLRTEAGITKSFEVRFQVDADGVWRLRSF
ncbi:MAG: PKD domain-containing protein [candidate division NC10 bacterium]|nr:PKD domain-containing protein [candidate division NC10 bacterium]